MWLFIILYYIFSLYLTVSNLALSKKDSPFSVLFTCMLLKRAKIGCFINIFIHASRPIPSLYGSSLCYPKDVIIPQHGFFLCTTAIIVAKRLKENFLFFLTLVHNPQSLEELPPSTFLYEHGV